MCCEPCDDIVDSKMEDGDVLLTLATQRTLDCFSRSNLGALQHLIHFDIVTTRMAKRTTKAGSATCYIHTEMLK